LSKEANKTILAFITSLHMFLFQVLTDSELELSEKNIGQDGVSITADNKLETRQFNLSDLHCKPHTRHIS